MPVLGTVFCLLANDSLAVDVGPNVVLLAAVCRYSAPEEVMEFPSHCSACAAPCTTRMFNIHIPFFKASQLCRLALADESL